MASMYISLPLVRVVALMALIGTCCLPASFARVIREHSHQQLQQPLNITFTELKPQIASIWVPSITTSTKSLQIPVTGLPGTPLPLDEMSRLVYTVTYTRQPAYVLQGTVSITPTASFSSTDQQLIQQPLVTLRQSSQSASIPDSRVRCSSLMVSHSNSVSCSFSTTIFALKGPPPSGTAQALISIPGTGLHVQTPQLTYDFSAPAAEAPASNLRLSSTDQQLFGSFLEQKPASATALVTNYFETRKDTILPNAVAGAQPPPQSVVSDTKVYTYTALFGDVPREKCGKKWKVLATASIESTSDGLQPPETATSEVDLELLGCEYLTAGDNGQSLHGCNEAAQRNKTTAASRDKRAAAAAAANQEYGAQQSAISQSTRLKIAARQPGAAAAAAGSKGVQIRSSSTSSFNKSDVKSPFVRPAKDRSTIKFHKKHSKEELSANSKKVSNKVTPAAAAVQIAAAADFRVSLTIDAPEAKQTRQAAAVAADEAPQQRLLLKESAAGNIRKEAGPAKTAIHTVDKSSSGSSSRMSRTSGKQQFVHEDGVVSTAALPANVFMAAAGSTLCGRHVCSPGQICMDDAVCCNPGSNVCGGSCCPRGNICMNGRCMAPGSSACGATACSPFQTCLSGKCCDTNAPVCGSTCCDANQMCVNGQCVASGSSACGGTVCGPNQQCLAPGVCCNAGESQCGASCCGAGNTCLNGQCVTGGSSLCVGQICGPGTVCAGGALCCPVGASFCGGQCCGSGNQCVDGRCVAFGSTPCGANICNADQTCQGGICCNRGESGCGAGCCATSAGMQCVNNQCVPAGTQPCGTTTCPPGTTCGDLYRSLCCAQGTRACAGNCCPAGHVCSWQQQQCVPWNSPEAGGGAHRNDVDFIAGLQNPGYGYGYNMYGRRHRATK